MMVLILTVLILAGLPAGLFVMNLFLYRRPPRWGGVRGAVSVLIPARNEELSIRAAVEHALASRDVDLEVLVLDDHSEDGTAQIVSEIAATDSRVRLLKAPPLPAGWCGKQHACWVLASQATYDLLVFVDADVRLEPDGLARMGEYMERSGADLISGIPRQQTGTFLERLLIPLIHWVLLGFLPLLGMRWSRHPAFGAGCGQLFMARRSAYHLAGGHAVIRTTLHDGLKLPTAFRKAGLITDLFDATDTATCRMYRSNAEVWRGLSKNATEGLASPGRIVPFTLLFVVGQVLPFFLLLAGPWLTPLELSLSLAAIALAYLPRLLSVPWFRQPITGAVLHPIAVVALLMIQWTALIRSLLGRPSGWKGRDYPT
jgi:hypothetical protein